MIEIMSNVMFLINIFAIAAIILIIIARWGKIRTKFKTDEGVVDIYRAILGIFNVLGFTIGFLITISGAFAILGLVEFTDPSFTGLSVLALGLAIMISGRDEIRSLSGDRDIQRIKEQLDEIISRLPKQK